MNTLLVMWGLLWTPGHVCDVQIKCTADNHCEAFVVGRCSIRLGDCLENGSITIGEEDITQTALGCDNAEYPRSADFERERE